MTISKRNLTTASLPPIDAYSADQPRNKGRFASKGGRASAGTTAKKQTKTTPTLKQRAKAAFDAAVLTGALTVAAVAGPRTLLKLGAIVGRSLLRTKVGRNAASMASAGAKAVGRNTVSQAAKVARAYKAMRVKQARSALDKAGGVVNGTFTRGPAGFLAAHDSSAEIHAYSPDQPRDKGRFTSSGKSSGVAPRRRAKKTGSKATPAAKQTSQASPPDSGSRFKRAAKVAGHVALAGTDVALDLATDPKFVLSSIVIGTVAMMKMKDVIRKRSVAVQAAESSWIFGEAADVVILGSEDVAPGGEPRLATFSVPAYNGGKLRVNGYEHLVVIDVAQCEFSPEIHANQFHDRRRLVGHVTRAQKVNNDCAITMDGVFSVPGEPQREILAAHQNKFPWKASIEAIPLAKPRLVARGERTFVNGQWQEGPFLLVPRSRLVGLAFLAVGADHDARVKIAAAAAQ